jgi:hypothetical protein
VRPSQRQGRGCELNAKGNGSRVGQCKEEGPNSIEEEGREP